MGRFPKCIKTLNDMTYGPMCINLYSALYNNNYGELICEGHMMMSPFIMSLNKVKGDKQYTCTTLYWSRLCHRQNWALPHVHSHPERGSYCILSPVFSEGGAILSPTELFIDYLWGNNMKQCLYNHSPLLSTRLWPSVGVELTVKCHHIYLNKKGVGEYYVHRVHEEQEVWSCTPSTHLTCDLINSHTAITQ